MLAFIYLLFSASASPAPDYLTDDLPTINETACGHCFRLYAPVCASDNRTYINECRMRCFEKTLPPEKQPYVLFYGPCIVATRRKLEWIGYNESLQYKKNDTVFLYDEELEDEVFS